MTRLCRLVRLVRGLAALAALAGLAAGIPWALAHYLGWPLPRQVPSWSEIQAGLTATGIPDTVLVHILALVVWAGWALLVTSAVTETAAAIRGQVARRLAVAGPLQPLAAHLVAAVALAAAAIATRPEPAGGSVPLVAALTGVPAGPAAISLVDALPTVPVANGQHPGAGALVAPGVPDRAELRRYQVQRRDTLWGIADRQLGDPYRWPQIFALNRDRVMADGRAFTDPDRIWPGWTLLLPAGTPPATVAVAPPPSAPGLRGPGTRTPEPAALPPAASAPSAPAGSTRPDTPPPAHEPIHDEHPGGVAVSPVKLPSGSVVGGSFAAGVAAALGLGRLRRRHGYSPRDPQPGRCLARSGLGPTLRRLSTAARPDGDDAGHEARLDRAALPLASDDPARRDQPDLIEVGARAGEPVSLALAGLGGAVLIGPGADDVARAWVSAVVVRAGPLAVEILITSAARDRLLPELPVVPGIRVVEDTDALLRRLEVETVGRSRQLGDSDTDTDTADAVAYRRANPGEPLPTLLAVVEALPAERAGRWRATLSTGSRLGLGALVLAATDAVASRFDVAADRTATLTAPPAVARRLAGVRLFGMTAAEVTEVLVALADSERRPDSQYGDDRGCEGRDEASPGAAQTGPTSSSEPSDALEVAPTPPWPDLPAAADRICGPAQPPGEPSPDVWAEPATAPPITVRLLGRCLIAVDGQPVSTGLRTVAKELLAWYLLRPDGATVEAAVEALWPDTDPRQVHRQFWLAAANLRTRLRGTDHPGVKVLVQTGEVYRAQAEVIGCDLWDFQAALGAAARAGDDGTARDALRRAVQVYRGDFAAAADYLWAEPVRADLHRRALDAHLRLAELDERAGHREAALAVLERAVALDGVAEEPYRRLMAAQARLGRPDAVRATWRALQRRLAELDLDPEPATVRLYRGLTVEVTTAVERPPGVARVGLP